MTDDLRCPSCGRASAVTERFCGSCGAALPHPDAETMTTPVVPRSSPALPRIASDGNRFLPGQVVADRYRMVGLLGRGGMGEVYRADDLKLGQPVALKFLPRDVQSDPARLQQFLTEVRLSLKVTHPNICRVFDIGEVDGRHFLSMEYVDGEDLASLLRRIGRLPEDKAVEVARQLCAGLAAAHSEGVLHRDLKPANVMIDGRGRAKLTDFGLAGATAGIAGNEARVGTPQYMAPEQFEGRELTMQTDLYSLGLVLYELFTGRRAFDSRDLNELAAMRTSAPTSPSAHVTGLNPVIERAILRCLDPEPARRPHSADSLAAALPGGDPLAMAIAAGETPSPEMVARSGGRGELRPIVAIGCLALVIAGLAVVWITEGRLGLVNRVPLPKPPAELEVAARTAIAAAGYTTPLVSSVSGFQVDQDYFDKVERENPSPARWDDLGSVMPSPVWFWYRASPRPLRPFSPLEQLNPRNPPMIEAGMIRVRLDPAGRLQELRVVPPELSETPGPWAEPDWTPLFALAGFAPAEWMAAEPTWAPPHATDVRRAWIRNELRLEAASFRGRPVWFRVVPPWRQPVTAMESAGTPAFGQQPPAVMVGIMLLFILGAGILARRNARMGRGDRRGATRLAAVFVGLGVVASILRLSGDPNAWFLVTAVYLAGGLLGGVIVWVSYLATEPYVRRLWPGTLVAWSRAIEGRFRDPLVGRHILLGALSGLGFTFLFSSTTWLSPLLGLGSPQPLVDFAPASSTAVKVASLLIMLQGSLQIPVITLLAVLVMRVIFKRPWVAYLALLMVFGVGAAFNPAPVMFKILPVVTIGFSILVVTRLGLLGFCVAVAFASWEYFLLTTDTSSWLFPSSVATMVLFAAVAIYGCVVSLGDQKLFKDTLMDGQGH